MQAACDRHTPYHSTERCRPIRHGPGISRTQATQEYVSQSGYVVQRVPRQGYEWYHPNPWLRRHDKGATVAMSVCLSTKCTDADHIAHNACNRFRHVKLSQKDGIPTSRRQLAPFLERISNGFWQLYSFCDNLRRAWATLSSFWCHLVHNFEEFVKRLVIEIVKHLANLLQKIIAPP